MEAVSAPRPTTIGRFADMAGGALYGMTTLLSVGSTTTMTFPSPR
jgi:hypothetical protein